MTSNGIRFRRLWRLVLYALTQPTDLFDAGLLIKYCLRICLLTDDRAAVATLVKKFVDRVLLKRVRLAALDRLRWHKQQNHGIVFVSASPDLYLTEFVSRLGVDRLLCTKFLSEEGNFSGNLFSANCKGEEKRRRLLEAYPVTEIDWGQSYGYGNSVDDVAFLELLGNAVAINPDAQLKKIALRRNWAIEIWS